MPGPLDHPELRSVDLLLDQRQLEEAQRRLAQLGQVQGLDAGVTYLATRLLFLRGRLQISDVATRLKDLLRAVHEFPEAEWMLAAAETGTLSRTHPPPRPAPPAATELDLPPPGGPQAPAEPPQGVGGALTPGAVRRASSPPPPRASWPPAGPLPRRPTPTESLEVPQAPRATPAVPAVAHGATQRIRSSFPAQSVPPPSPPPRDEPPQHDSLEVPRAPSWPPLSARQRTRHLGSLDAFDSSPPPEARRELEATLDAPEATLDAPDAATTDHRTRGATSTPPTARSASPGQVDALPPLDLVLDEEPSSDALRMAERAGSLPAEDEPAGPRGSEPSLDGSHSRTREDSIGNRVTDDGLHARPRHHVSTDRGMGDPAHGALQDESIPSHLRRLMSPAIPRAPGLPKFALPRDQTPSYAPARRGSGELASPTRDELVRKISTELQAQPPEVQHISDLPPPDPQRAPSAHPAPTRYSEAPAEAEYVYSRAPSGPPRGHPSEPPPLPSEPPTRRRTPKPQRPTSDWPRAPHPSRPPAHRGHSDRPPSPVGHTPERPSLFEVANLLDQERYREALSALAGVTADVEHLLMKARALAGSGARDEALGVLERLCESPTLDPELRAGAARLMIDLGRADLALAQARHAMSEAPEPQLVRLSLAWAAVRELFRTGEAALAREAEAALDGLKSRGGPHPGLVQALRACVQAYVGEAERAIGVAQRALGLDPRSADALAAITVASARLERVHDAQQGWLRLYELSTPLAEMLRRELEGARIEVLSPGPASRRGFGAEEDARNIWPASELEILDGDSRSSQVEFERVCRQRLSEVALRGEDEGFPAIAHVAVHVMTEHPVFCHFAPYDLSLWSISRARAGLSLLYDAAQQLPADADDFPVVLLVGAYLGQVLCQAHDAHWDGSLTDLVNAQVVSVERCWSPFLIVADRLRDGTSLDFGIADDLKRAHPGADQWSEQVAPSVAPPSLWGEAPWPRPALIPRLGRALSHSVVSEWCRRNASGPLDGSMASLGALDAYLSLIAPPAARAQGTEPWLARVSVMAGAYLGEVLRVTVGGAWAPGTHEHPSPIDYQLRLGTRVATPVAEVCARLTGRSTLSLLDYASKLARS